MRPGRLNAGSIRSSEQFVVNTYTTPSFTWMPSSALRNTAWSSVSRTVLRSRRATSMSSKKMMPLRFTVNRSRTACTGLHDRRAAWYASGETIWYSCPVRRHSSHSHRHALVFPLPGGPVSSSPRFARPPSSLIRFRLFRSR